MTAQTRPMPHIPGLVRILDPVARRLLAAGVPMGPNTLLTVRGRRSGLPRHFAVAVVELDGRRWVIGTFGEANWVRNLRSAGVGELRIAGRDEPVIARELGHAETAAFFGNVLRRYVRKMSLPGRSFINGFRHLAAPEVLDDPEAAARARPVFELIPG